MGTFGKRAVPIIAVELTPIRIAPIHRFIPDENIQPPIAVIIKPSGSHGRMEAQQPGFLGHVCKSSVAVVPQQGFWDSPRFAQPTPAHHPNIEQTVIVVVRLGNIQRAYFTDQTSLARTLRECAIALVAEVAELAFMVPRRYHQVIESVIVEIVYNDSSRQIVRIDPQAVAHIEKAWHVVL